MSARCSTTPIYWDARPIDSPGNPADIRARFGREADATILESVASPKEFGQWSMYACRPRREISSAQHTAASDPFEFLRCEIATWRSGIETGPFPFVGGWMGYFTYEAGRWIEPKAGWRHATTPFGFARWRLYDTVLLHDRRADRWFVAGIDLRDGAPPLAQRFEQIESIARDTVTPDDALPPIERTTTRAGGWNMSADEYLSNVERILNHIRSGDIYQANLTRRYETNVDCDSLTLYQSLCRTNPAAFAAYLRVDDAREPMAILSSSPELFLSLDDGIVTTRPIKGTRRRTGNPASDDRAVAELSASEKERAELNMIIDLERNDLGRVCEYGSIDVVSGGEIEIHPTVFHRTATICGRLRSDCDAVDLLRATFPGGSITGAPKIRAMQIIDELEPSARGPYCGAIGYVGVDGNMRLSLPIRTMTMCGRRVELAVGSGIVADSSPVEELAELDAKAAGMMRALAECQSANAVPDLTAGLIGAQ